MKPELAEQSAKTIEHGASTLTYVFFGTVWLQWLNNNAQAVVALCAIGTLIITAVAAYIRMKYHKKLVGKRRKSD